MKSNNRSAFISLMAILLVISILLTASFFANENTLDLYWGKGKSYIVTSADSKGWDVEFYSTYTEQEIQKNSYEVSKKITDEGIVLLKNDGLLPLKKGAEVTPFGCRYYYPAYTGIGSGNKKAEAYSPKESIESYFEVSDKTDELLRNAKVQELSATAIKETNLIDHKGDFFGEVTSIYEYDPDVYRALNDISQTVGIVFIGRYGGENYNFSTTAYYDGTPHALALTSYERETIAIAKQKCSAVIVIVNSSNVMQIGELMSGELECNAVVWLGGAGSTGFLSLAQMLCGEIVPSGRTVDVWSSDLLTDPVVKNFQDMRYVNAEGIVIASNYASEEKPAGLYFLEYEEGIYVGYRYYETAADIGTLNYGSISKNGKRLTAGAVNYPFGYGLSYTTFEQTIKEVVTDNTTITVTVEVSNVGAYDGKEVVQLYYESPYTQYDRNNMIEKATKNLVAFNKVFVAAGETKQVQLKFQFEDMASYSFLHANLDGTVGCYILEEGNYKLYLGKNSHESFDTEILPINSTVFYEGKNLRSSDKNAQSKMLENGETIDVPQNEGQRYTAVYNRFDDVTTYMLEDGMTILSRNAWNATQPTSPVAKRLSEERLRRATSFDPFTDERLGNVSTNPDHTTDAPPQKQPKELTFSDMRGIDYFDPIWDSFLNALDLTSDEVKNILTKAAYQTAELSAIDKPSTFDTDGPQGLTRVKKGTSFQTYGYACQVVLGATYNRELAYLYGDAIGREALISGVNGWYAPGLNLHRGAFEGRNYEYFAEDPLLSGKMGAQVISGAADNGVLTYVKHFAMNNYEGPATCLSVWATEQTIRELYLKSFEIAVKEARRTVKYIKNINGEQSKKIMRGCMGIMGAANMIGTEWCAANYDLLFGVLRGEWGFNGVVTTDMALQTSSGVVDKIFRAGGDLRMYYRGAELLDSSSATVLTYFRSAIKNICYAYVNGNIMQGVSPGSIVAYHISPWKFWILTVDAIVACIEVGLAIYLIRSYRDR